MSETHRREKKKLDEQQQKMKMVTKRTKDLCKHIDFIATHLNEAQDALGKEAAQNGQPKLEYVDYRNLPGLHLAKLLLDDKTKKPRSESPVHKKVLQANISPSGDTGKTGDAPKSDEPTDP